MLSLNYRDARPIYEQVRDGLRRLVATGAIAEGEPLPTARDLAARFAINPTAVRRAYADLEAEGFLTAGESQAPTARLAGEKNAYQETLWRKLDEAVEELLLLGVPGRTLVRRVEEAAGGPPAAEKPRLSVNVNLGGKQRKEEEL